MNKSIQYKLTWLGGFLGAMMLSSGVYAGEIQVENAWARATAPGQDSAMVDLDITSKHAATLAGVSSKIAKTAALHSMTHESGMMKMREVKSIELPAGKRVNLGESGYHLMLNGLKAPLKAGETVPLILEVKAAGSNTEKIETTAEIRPLTAVKAMPEGGHMQHRH